MKWSSIQQQSLVDKLNALAIYQSKTVHQFRERTLRQEDNSWIPRDGVLCSFLFCSCRWNWMITWLPSNGLLHSPTTFTVLTQLPFSVSKFSSPSCSDILSWPYLICLPASWYFSTSSFDLRHRNRISYFFSCDCQGKKNISKVNDQVVCDWEKNGDFPVTASPGKIDQNKWHPMCCLLNKLGCWKSLVCV